MKYWHPCNCFPIKIESPYNPCPKVYPHAPSTHDSWPNPPSSKMDHILEILALLHFITLPPLFHYFMMLPCVNFTAFIYFQRDYHQFPPLDYFHFLSFFCGNPYGCSLGTYLLDYTSIPIHLFLGNHENYSLFCMQWYMIFVGSIPCIPSP